MIKHTENSVKILVLFFAFWGRVVGP